MPNTIIPGFEGDLFQNSDLGYREANKQYATSSYSAKDMSPYAIGFPKNDNDICSAIRFAKENKKKIVARSGGHQYTGKSSGGQDTIVLDMENFSEKSVGDETNGERFAEVGPGARLEDIAKIFAEKGVTIPHGECPRVAIGGHAQTGGYGHLCRSFGLALDWVDSFDIILADRKKRTVRRSSEDKLDKEIFWGVLGGNAGSFGVVTKYTFKCIQDEHYPGSYGFTSRRFYKKEVYKSLMKQVQSWTKRIKNGTLPPGIDFMMTVESNVLSSPSWEHFLLPNPPIKLSALIVELVSTGKKGVASPDPIAEREFDPIIKAVRRDNDDILSFDFHHASSHQLKEIKNKAAKLLIPLLGEDSHHIPPLVEKIRSIDGDTAKKLIGEFWREEEKEKPKSLSALSESFVRKYPFTTIDGREFAYPYKKRINCTVDVLTDEFVNKFTDMVDKVVEADTGEEDSGVHLVFQMVLGGGKYKENGGSGETSIPQRDITFQFVFDLFYEERGRDKAIEFQDEMQKIVENHFNEDKQERRMFWGTFDTKGKGVKGSATDIADPAVRAMYYDSPAQYERLQSLKQEVDPCDIFSTELTVKPLET